MMHPRVTPIREESGAHADRLCSPLLDGLSVDVEDYYQVEAFADRIRPEMWTQFPSRVADNTRRVLELLDHFQAKATFFILGWVAEREKKLVREVLNAGHELACHSYLHQCVWRLGKQQFREDTRRARCAIEDAGGQKVVGYRAPTFSIFEKSLWAIEILAEEGFLYDSSVFPIRHDLYGMPRAPRFPFQWVCPNGLSLYEIPPLTTRLLGQNLPAAGGGHLRLLPMWYTRWAVRRVRQKDRRPVLVYFHPWELDPEQPRIRGKWTSVFRHYLNIRRMQGRIGEILSDGNFVSLADFLNNQLSKGPLPTEAIVMASPRN